MFGLKANVGICFYVGSLIDLLKSTGRKSLPFFFFNRFVQNFEGLSCSGEVRTETAEDSKEHYCVTELAVAVKTWIYMQILKILTSLFSVIFLL